MECWTVTVRK